jgi:protocatechuate 3,4-dioxygenase beta subunit
MLRGVFSVLCLLPAVMGAQVVEGRVLNDATGDGVPGVAVRLFGVGNYEGPGDYEAITDSEGRFRFDAVIAGGYHARYTAPGFDPVPSAGSILPPFGVADGSEPVRLEVKMQPLVKVSGQVVDASAKPVSGAAVWLVRGDRWCGPPACFPEHRVLTTGETGTYSAPDIAPGRWLLCATAPSSWKPPESQGGERQAWAQTCYPGAADTRLAEGATVQPGGEQWLPDIKLASVAAYRVHGQVFGLDGKPLPDASVALGSGAGPGLMQKTDGDGEFEFGTVAEGEWRLSATLENGGVKLRATRSLRLPGEDLEALELSLTRPFSLRGKIVMKAPEGASVPPLPPIDLVLVSGSALLSDGGAAFIPLPSDNGDIEAAGVYPGTYEILPISESPAPYYLDSVRVGEQDGLGPVAIFSGADALTVTYKLGGGTVGGSAEACGAGRAVLIPQDAALRHAGFIRVTDCDANGRFEFPAVRPGEYFGLIADGSPASLVSLARDENVLKSAAGVTVRENETVVLEMRR